jgi:hypothetical protein
VRQSCSTEKPQRVRARKHSGQGSIQHRCWVSKTCSTKEPEMVRGFSTEAGIPNMLHQGAKEGTCTHAPRPGIQHRCWGAVHVRNSHPSRSGTSVRHRASNAPHLAPRRRERKNSPVSRRAVPASCAMIRHPVPWPGSAPPARSPRSAGPPPPDARQRLEESAGFLAASPRAPHASRHVDAAAHQPCSQLPSDPFLTCSLASDALMLDRPPPFGTRRPCGPHPAPL